MSCCLPYEREQRKLLGEFFRHSNGDPTQEYLDSFREEHPEFEYIGLALLITKRRQLLSLGVLEPFDEEDRRRIAEYKEGKKKTRIRAEHPATRHYQKVRNCNRIMRSQIHY